MSLVVKNISKSFIQNDQKIEVLKNVNFEVAKGQSAAILGQSGSGKSTLLSLLVGLDRPDHGEIIYNGVSVTGMSENEMTQFRANNLSLVFQQYHLIQHLTALENVMIPLEILNRKGFEEISKKFLQEVGLESRMAHFPYQLSGGESQRVALARAMASEPKFLFADEPSGNLDVETGHKVMSFFFDLVKRHQLTSVIVTHSVELSRQCDRVFRLNQGVMIEE